MACSYPHLLPGMASQLCFKPRTQRSSSYLLAHILLLPRSSCGKQGHSSGQIPPFLQGCFLSFFAFFCFALFCCAMPSFPTCLLCIYMHCFLLVILFFPLFHYFPFNPPPSLTLPPIFPSHPLSSLLNHACPSLLEHQLVQFLVRSFDLVKKATIVGTPVRILSNYYDTKKQHQYKNRATLVGKKMQDHCFLQVHCNTKT